MQQYDTNPQPVTTPPQPLNPNLTFALPAIQFSDRHFDGIVENELNYTESALLFDFLGNMEAKSGTIHKRTVADFAKRHGVQPSNFYGKDGYIARLNATKMVKLKIKDHQLCGRVTEVPSKRLKNKKYRSKYPLKVSVLSADCLTLLLPLSRKKTVLRMLLCMALHVDKKSGELNTIQSTKAWGELIGGIKRINCDRAADFLIETGILEATRQFVVSGSIPSVAMGNAFLLLSAEKEKERRRQEKEEKRVVGYDYRTLITALQHFFGLNARGWMQAHLREARRRLLFFIEQDGLDSLAALKKRLGEGEASDQAKSYTEGPPLNWKEVQRSKEVGDVLSAAGINF